MQSLAVVMQEPRRLALADLTLDSPTADDVVVETRWSGVSSGTEKLLYTGRMPMFPGMGYPLVPGYETVGEIVEAGASGLSVGAQVFVPGARCYGAVRGLHGGSASRLVVPAARALPTSLGADGVLLALAATALHALDVADPADSLLIVGHGALGRLAARAAVQRGLEVAVWEKNAARTGGARSYEVSHPDADPRRDYKNVLDMSGDAQALDALIARLAPRGRVTLAGFYESVGFAFPPAFMREAEIRIAAQWGPNDLARARDLAETGALPLDGVVSHRRAAREAAEAYGQAFEDADCVKMVLDWSAT